jgi:MoaE-MoaD fusion protein
MKVNVLFFAQARERAGRASVELSLPEGSRLADALAALAREHAALEPLWPHMAIAVNGRLARPEAPLEEGAELALLPPVSGG